MKLIFVDEVAVPDYPSGATEHWGIITYREVYLLYDPTEVAADGQIRTLAVIAHEMAHNVGIRVHAHRN